MKVIELFAGIGSQTQALKNLEIAHEIIGISEIDKYAIKSYEAIHGPVKNFGDITKIEKLPYCDLLTYSFPCQDISVAGKQAGIAVGTRSGLLYEVERLLENMEEKPKYLLLENVKNLVGKGHKADFDKWLLRLEEMGYKNYWKVLNAKDYGIPQNRERVFVVSIRNDIKKEYEFLEKQELTLKLKDMLESEVDEKYFLKGSYLEWWKKNKEKQPKIIVKEATKQGYAVAEIGDSINIEQPNSKTRRGRVGKGVAQTLTTSPQQVTLQENYRIRKLTPLECWNLMGFKDEQFYKAKSAGVSDSQLYKQAGNSIVVNVLEAIFKNLF